MNKTNNNLMSDKIDMYYRFNSETDPTDEQLAQIMKEVAIEAKTKAETAYNKLFHEIDELIERSKPKWNELYNIQI